VENPVPQPIPTPAVSPELTVDQVIDALEKIKAQKAELEKKEQALLDVLNKKLAKQTERLKNVGWKSVPKQMPETVLPVTPAGEPAPLVNTPPKQR
jgi:hypothetical protein